jgi:hypothetical protein
MRSLEMKTTSIAIVVVMAAGCSDEADIGVSSTPVTCRDVAFADVSGSVSDPNNGTDYDFDSATPLATRTATGGTSLSLNGGSLLLRFGFYCGAAERARYGVKPDNQDGLDCPLEVAGAVLGRIEYLPAKSGTLIIDENSNCLAGRFAVDFGSNGSIDGSFSANWTQQ